MRFDVPVIGEMTVAVAREAKLKILACEAKLPFCLIVPQCAVQLQKAASRSTEFQNELFFARALSASAIWASIMPRICSELDDCTLSAVYDQES